MTRDEIERWRGADAEARLAFRAALDRARDAGWPNDGHFMIGVLRAALPGVLHRAEVAAHAAGLAQGRAEMLTARPLDDWHEDIGAVLWWAWPVREPPYAGTPLDDDFPEYMTHWTPIVCPERALPDTSEESER